VTAARSVRRAPLASLDDLREHLQWALELEHATLPPYLCALYSLDPGRNPDAAAVISGVAVEEMLHLALVANILNAVGGQPRLDYPSMLTAHPRPMPHGDRSLQLSLLPFGPAALEMFLRIERPAGTGAPDEASGYETIGQFYEAVEDGLRALCSRLGEAAVFCGDPGRQITAAHFRHTAGRLVVVDSLATALAALEEIVEQGEGSGPEQVWDGDADPIRPGDGEVAHYYRFQELKLGRRYQPGDTALTGPTGAPIALDLDGVRPMRPNPQLADHPPGHPVRVAQEEFNRTYCSLLAQLEQAFSVRPDLLAAATGTMFALKAQAGALMQLPDGPGRTAGPSFDYVPPAVRRAATDVSAASPGIGSARTTIPDARR
jgi:Ferritin-like